MPTRITPPLALIRRFPFMLDGSKREWAGGEGFRLLVEEDEEEEGEEENEDSCDLMGFDCDLMGFDCDLMELGFDCNLGFDCVFDRVDCNFSALPVPLDERSLLSRLRIISFKSSFSSSIASMYWRFWVKETGSSEDVAR